MGVVKNGSWFTPGFFFILVLYTRFGHLRFVRCVAPI